MRMLNLKLYGGQSEKETIMTVMTMTFHRLAVDHARINVYIYNKVMLADIFASVPNYVFISLSWVVEAFCFVNLFIW